MKTFKNFNEGVFDLLTKKGREKRAGERDEKKIAQAKKDQEDKDFDSWKYYADKAASPRGTADDAKKAKKMENLPHVKARVKAIRDKASAFKGQSQR